MVGKRLIQIVPYIPLRSADPLHAA
jgi:hypothetical protein